jgi:hypothetical protein
MNWYRLDKRKVSFIGLVLAFAPSALANHISTASVAATCTSYTLTATGGNLNHTATFGVEYKITLTPTTGPVIVITDTFPVIPDAAGNFSATVTHSLSGLNGTYTLSGSASLLENGVIQNTVAIVFTPLTLTCRVGGTGCPATIGFWKNEKKHPFPNSVQSAGLTIAGVTYTESDLYTILNNNGGNAVAILGRQLVGALLNLAAGGKDNAAADVAIATAEALLKANNLNLLTSSVAPSTTLGQALLTQESILDGYNGSDFNTCSEGSGLTLGGS